jgi:hypothetical protein
MTGVTPDVSPLFSLEPRSQRSEGTMRSNDIRNRNYGIQNAQQSAKAIAGRVADRLSAFALSCASTGFASRMWLSMRWALRHTPTATRTVKPRVTGGVLYAVAVERSGRCATACRLAAR